MYGRKRSAIFIAKSLSPLHATYPIHPAAESYIDAKQSNQNINQPNSAVSIWLATLRVLIP
jgi:hypothetical protein